MKGRSDIRIWEISISKTGCFLSKWKALVNKSLPFPIKIKFKQMNCTCIRFAQQGRDPIFQLQQLHHFLNYLLQFLLQSDSKVIQPIKLSNNYRAKEFCLASLYGLSSNDIINQCQIHTDVEEFFSFGKSNEFISKLHLKIIDRKYSCTVITFLNVGEIY